MDFSGLTFETAEFLEAIEVANLSSNRDLRCEDFSPIFGKESEEDTLLKNSLSFLAIVCSWRLDPDNSHEPFEYLFHTSTVHSITEPQCNCINEALTSVSCEDLHARLCDLLWIKNKCHRSARNAVDSYLKSAEKIINSNTRIGEHERLHRAIQIAVFLGREKESFEKARKIISCVASNEKLETCISHGALQLLLEFDRQNSLDYHRVSLDRINYIRSNGPTPVWERAFWKLAATAASISTDEKKRDYALVEIAKTYEQEAIETDNPLNKASHLQLALESYRKVPNTEQDRERIHKELLCAQKEFPSVMKPIKGNKIDLSDVVKAAIKTVEGKDLFTSLAVFSFCVDWEKKAVIEAEAKQLIEKYPVAHLFSSSQLGSTGKVSATAPGGTYCNDQKTNLRMCSIFKSRIEMKVFGIIEPIRNQILLSHSISIKEIELLLSSSPFIPQDRISFFVVGIHAGFHGKFIESLHILVPQLEHMVRYILNEKGVVTSSLSSDGIQDEHDLNRLLLSPELEKIFGEDLCFALKTVFISRFGYNLRNELAHGMLHPNSLFQNKSIYAWWLIYRIVATPISNTIFARANSSEESESVSSDPPTSSPPSNP